MRKYKTMAVGLLLSAALAGCSNSSAPTGSGAARADAGKSIYSFANACYALQALPSNHHVRKDGGSWAASEAGLGNAAAFFFKPTGLGSYLLYDAQGQMLGLTDPLGDLVDELGNFVGQAGALVTALGNIADRTEEGRVPVGNGLRYLGREIRDAGNDAGDNRIAPALGVLAEPTDLAIWNLSMVREGVFELTHQVTGLRLVVVPEDQGLALAEPPVPADVGQFNIVPQQGCAPFPEAQLNAEVLAPPKRLNDDGTVFGWVDAHNHIVASEFLGGRVNYGQPFHRLGIAHALGNCEEHHGPQGLVSPLNYFVGSGPHDTVGWPTFSAWPGPNELLHHQTYYLWMKRAFLSGQKIMVNHFVENEGMCMLHTPLNRNDCDEMESVRNQHHKLLQLQDYIDAQEGGPGEGWFRIVTSPKQAREVIAGGKMAVVMGIEVSKVLDCGETLDVPDCSLEDIHNRLDDVYKMGIRNIYPVHRQDNAFGGAKPGGPEPINVVVAVGTVTDSTHVYRLEGCAEPGENQNDQPPPGLFEEIANFLSFLTQAAGGPALPGASGEGELCNARGMTPHGEYLINEMMAKHMLIEIDHSGERVRDRILEIAAERKYPVVSAHSWTASGAFPKIWRVGGALNMYSNPADGYVRNVMEVYKPAAPEGAYLGVGIGTDANGLGPLPGPRASAAEHPMTYPFKSYDGNVVFDKQVTGERVFDLNTDGVAHYGLYADITGDIQQNGGEGKEEAMQIFFRSAEAYLRMWERAEGTRQ